MRYSREGGEKKMYVSLYAYTQKIFCRQFQRIKKPTEVQTSPVKNHCYGELSDGMTK